MESEKKNIYVKIFAGLGNQIFQIASAYGMAKRFNMNLIIYYSHNKVDYEHNKDLYEFVNTIFKPFNCISETELDLKDLYTYSELDNTNNAYCYNHNIIDQTRDNLLLGYFQNEKYFIENKEEILNLLKNNLVYEKVYKECGNRMDNSYFIHYRRGDYVGYNLFMIDYDKYFKLAIEYILEKDPNAHFYIISNDEEYCKTYEPFKNINKTFYQNNDTLETLYFMSFCKKGGICSNSSFSWWGSYLNDNLNKLVLFPSKWAHTYKPFDIYYKNSIIIAI